jgi:hypothetical protein
MVETVVLNLFCVSETLTSGKLVANPKVMKHFKINRFNIDTTNTHLMRKKLAALAKNDDR